MSVVPILLYHSIDETSSTAYSRWVVTPRRFERHMSLIVEHGYNPMTVRELSTAIAGRRQLPPRPVAVTFDDGLRDFMTGAMPILSRYRIPATLFAVAGYIQKTSCWLHDLGEGARPMLSWAELRSIAEAGVEIGAHTCTHPQLDILPPRRASDEIAASKRILEEQLSREVHSFAYPHGYASRTTRALVRSAGYGAACRVRNAFCSTSEDVFGLSRIVITDDMNDEEVMAVLQGRGFPVAPAADRVAAQAWRLARRLRGHRELPEFLQHH